MHVGTSHTPFAADESSPRDDAPPSATAASLRALIAALDAASDAETAIASFGQWVAARAPSVRARVVDASEEAASGDARTIAVPAADDRVVLFAAGDAAAIDASQLDALVVAARLLGGAISRARTPPTPEPPAVAGASGTAHDFFGPSRHAAELVAKLPRLAASDVNVLLEGDTGVGKTFMARLVHEGSARAAGALRVLNCAAIPEGLFESELFGHERGAFTGAVARRIGALEATGRGTLFLDEIGELSLTSQAKLLRVLEERRFERVGSNRTVELQARIVCATNRDLDAMVESGAFRRDLLFRVAVLRVRVPALRERAEDLPDLAAQLLAQVSRAAGRRVVGFAPDALAAMRRYDWPGNMRELRNVMEHAVAMGDGPVVELADLPPSLAGAAAAPEDGDVVHLPLDMATLERRAMRSALRNASGNRSRAAALLGVSRSTLYNKLKAHGLVDD